MDPPNKSTLEHIIGSDPGKFITNYLRTRHLLNLMTTSKDLRHIIITNFHEHGKLKMGPNFGDLEKINNYNFGTMSFMRYCGIPPDTFRNNFLHPSFYGYNGFFNNYFRETLLSLTIDHIFIYDTALKPIIDSFSLLKSLTKLKILHSSLGILNDYNPLLSTLTTLRVFIHGGQNPKLSDDTLGILTNLEKLSIGRCPGSISNIGLNKLSKLHTLKLGRLGHWNDNITIAGLNFVNLKCLDVKSSDVCINDASSKLFWCEPNHISFRLKKLVCDHEYISEDFLESQTSLETLEFGSKCSYGAIK